jgi:hypothetical protein
VTPSGNIKKLRKRQGPTPRLNEWQRVRLLKPNVPPRMKLGAFEKN